MKVRQPRGMLWEVERQQERQRMPDHAWGERLTRVSLGQAGGNAARLVGLYHGARGAHTYFLKVKEVPRWGGYTVNLLHYEDAARLTMSVSV